MTNRATNRRTLLGSALLMAGGSAIAPAFASGPAFADTATATRDFDAEIIAALRAAKDAAGLEHFGTLDRLGLLPPSNGAPSTTDVTPAYITDPSKAPAKATWYADATQVFDDLYFVGGSIHSAWLLKTSAGLILIDTIWQYNAKTLILDGMRKFGFSPTDIKRIIVSHAHADHIGGVQVVQEATEGAPVIMGAPDWDAVLARPKTFLGTTPDVATGIRVDADAPLYNVHLGDTTVRIIPTPGHTPGTLSMIFTVHDFGEPVTVAYVGGTAFNFQNSTPVPGIANYQTYIDSVLKMQKAASTAGATVLMSNHTEFDNAWLKARMMGSRGFGPNPFVNGAASVDNYFTMTQNCAVAAQLALVKKAAA